MSEFKPSVDTVLEAIDTLYNSKDKFATNKASTWLSNYQKESYAWDLSFQIVIMNQNTTASILSAQIIRNKIRSDFENLPPENQNQLKESLLNITKQAGGVYPKLVINQLALAVADLFCTMTSWKDSLNELAHVLSTNIETRKILLDILCSIPVEVKNNQLKLGMNRKNVLILDFETNRSGIFQILATIGAEQQDPSYQAKVFLTLKSWWNLKIFTFEDLKPYSNLIENAFIVLKNPQNVDKEFYDSAVSWITTLLDFLHDCEPNQEIGIQLLANIYSLSTIISNVTEETYEILESLADLLYSLLYVCSDHLLFSPTYPFSVGSKFDSLVFTIDQELMSLPPKNLGDTRTLNLYIALIKLNRNIINTDIIQTLFSALSDFAKFFIAQERCEELDHEGINKLNIIRPFMKEIFTALIPHCVVDEESADLMEIDEFNEYREEMTETLKDICVVLGVESIFVDLIVYIKSLFASLEKNPNSHEDLMQLEACLYVSSILISKLVSRDPDHIIRRFYEEMIFKHFQFQQNQMPPGNILNVLCMVYFESKRYLSYNFAHRNIITTNLLNIFDYAIVTSDKSFTELIRRNVISNCLTAIGGIIKESSDSFYEAYSNTEQEEPTIFLDQIWNDLIGRIFTKLSSYSGEYPIDAVRSIFEGVARCQMVGIKMPRRRSSGNPHRSNPAISFKFILDFPEKMTSLLSIPLNAIQNILTHNVKRIKEDHITDVSLYLQMITSYIKNLESVLTHADATAKANEKNIQPIQNSINDCARFIKAVLWPLIMSVMTKFGSETRPIEYSCSCMRYSIRAFQDQIRDIVPDIAEKIVAQNLVYPHGCFLYLSSVIIDQYSSNNEFHEGLLKLFQTMNLSTIKLFEKEGLSVDPYIVDDYFRMCLRILQTMSDKFINDSRIDFEKILEIGIASFDLGDKISGHSIFTKSEEVNIVDLQKGNDQKVEKEENTDDLESAKFSAKSFLKAVLVFIDRNNLKDDKIFTEYIQNSTQTETSLRLAGRRILTWLAKSQKQTANLQRDENPISKLSGGEKLLTSLFHAWCLHSDHFDVRDVTELFVCLKLIVPKEVLINWLSTAIKFLPLRRSDGHEKATFEQCSSFVENITNSDRGLERHFTQFASLFV